MAHVKPLMKLPRKGMQQHPVVQAYEVLKSRGLSMREIILLPGMKMTVQGFYDMVKHAREDRDYVVPSHRIPALSKHSGIAPHYFDPYLYPDVSWSFADAKLHDF